MWWQISPCSLVIPRSQHSRHYILILVPPKSYTMACGPIWMGTGKDSAMVDRLTRTHWTLILEPALLNHGRPSRLGTLKHDGVSYGGKGWMISSVIQYYGRRQEDHCERLSLCSSTLVANECLLYDIQLFSSAGAFSTCTCVKIFIKLF